MNTLLKLLNRLTLNTKLLVVLGLSLMVTLTVGLSSLVSIRSLSEMNQQTYEQELLGVAHILEAKASLTMMGRDLRWMAMSSDTEIRTAGRTSVVDAEKALRRHIDEASSRIRADEGIAALSKFNEVFPAYANSVKHTVALLDKHDARADSEAIRFLGGTEYDQTILAADHALDEIAATTRRSARLSAEHSTVMAARAKQLNALALGFGVLASIFFGWLIGRSISGPLNDLKHSVEKMAAGHLDDPVPHAGMGNEIGAMADALCVLKQGAQAQAQAAWVKTHSAELLNALQGLDDMAEFSRRLMSRLTPLLSVQVGVLYYRVPDTDNYSLWGSYGYLHRKGFPQQFAIGEGLVGQCVIEQEPITVSELDDDYIQIASGMGNTPPRYLVVAPMIAPSGEIPAVLEFAALSSLGAREQALLDEVLPMLALSITMLERNAKTRELLSESQRQQQALAEQEQQMRRLSLGDTTTKASL